LPRIHDLPDPEIGVRYDFNVATHCGLGSATIDGQLWLPVGGAVARQGGNFDFNVDQGSIILTDPDHATYTSSGGQEVELKRWERAPPSIPPCD
jgi:long-subunit fatty acid transport protein